MALVPKEVVHRTVNQSAERLRTQIREVAQEGKRDTFGGDQIEDWTVDGSQLAARGAVRLAKQVQKKQKTERQQVFQQQRVSQVQINRAAQEKRAVQPWLNQESNQQTVNIKSKEVYLSQQTQTPITEVVRTEKVNWQYIQRGVRQQTIQQHPAQRIGIEQPSEKAVHYRAEHRHRTQSFLNGLSNAKKTTQANMTGCKWMPLRFQTGRIFWPSML